MRMMPYSMRYSNEGRAPERPAFCILAFHHLPPESRGEAVREMRRVLRPGGVAVIVDWRRPTSFLKALTSPMFLVYLVHSLAPRDAQLDEAGIRAQMNELGFKEISTPSFGPGGTIGAVVGRLAP
jgi:SAM-dependent methyltransferase